MLHTMDTLYSTGKVTSHGDCLIRNGALAGKGYPVVADDRERYVHRLVALLSGAPIEVGKQAAHRCGNSRCINPEHIYSATQAENESDKKAHGTYNHGRPGVTHCGRYLGNNERCKKLPHDGPCKPDIFEQTYQPAG